MIFESKNGRYDPLSTEEYLFKLELLGQGGKDAEESSRVGFYQKDYFFSLKVSPLKEGKYYPAIAVGGNDPSRSIN